MKIAIQGHPTRGKEVIKILESLGGRNTFNYLGECIGTAYHIGMDYSIYGFCAYNPKVNFKVYTLEEFEKEFPFKVGDKVTIITNTPYKIIALEYHMGRLSYKLDNGLNCYSNVLTPYKEMKKERNITLTLDKAKEWYKKGGELKEIALQAFSEKELTKVDLPKTWKEFCDNYPVRKGETWLGIMDRINVCSDDLHPRYHKNWIPSQKSAEAHLAMIQLEQLRDCWRQGWKPTEHNTGYCITNYPYGYLVMTFCFISFLSFPTKEMAEEFLKCFKDLIEQAGDLI